MNGLFQSVLDCCDRMLQRFEKNESSNLMKIGIASSIGAVVAACVATHKSEKVISKAKEETVTVQEELSQQETDETTVNRAVGKIWLKAGMKISGYYVIVGGLEAVSLSAFVTNNDHQNGKIAMLSTMLASMTQRMYDYRRIIAERYGREAEEEAYYGVEKKNIQVMEDGKLKNKKVRVISEPPANKNILCFAPWTSTLYVDEEMYGCQGQNRDRIRGAMKTVGDMVNYSRNGFVSTNDIAYELQIQPSADWYVCGYVKGDEVRYSVREVYTEYEGRYIPIYYIELNTIPFLEERIKQVLPEAPNYTAELANAI